jgi:hypothetical protein
MLLNVYKVFDETPKNRNLYRHICRMTVYDKQ